MTARPRVWISAGGTAEPIDDVRSVTNASTGRFGAALARAFVRLGAHVTVLASADLARHPDWLPGATVWPFRTAAELSRLLDDAAHRPPDLLLMAAAVADYSPVPAAGKIRSDAESLSLELKRNPKILAGLRARCGPGTALIGFKLLSHVTTQELEAVARTQLDDNHLDGVVANDLRDLSGGQHPVLLVDGLGTRRIDGRRDDVAAALAHALLEGRRGLEPAPVPALTALDLDLPRYGRVQAWWEVRTPAHHNPLRVDGPDAAAVHALLKHHAPSAWTRVAVAVAADRVWLGGATLDRWADQRVLGRAGPDAIPLVADAAVRGALVGDGRTVQTDDPAADHWLPWCLAAHGGARWRVGPTLAPTLIRRGFGVEPDGETVDGPWARGPQPAASVCLVDVAGRAVLLGQRQAPPAEGLWAFPGGKVEPGEDPWPAARRELLEETGIALTPARDLPATTVRVWAGHDPTYAIDAHVVPILGQPTPTPGSELDAQWLPLDGAALLPLAPGVRRVLDDLPWLLPALR